MKAGNYSELWQKIHHEARQKGFPLRVMFELTYRCNFKCRHCYVPDSYKVRRREMSTKEVFSILDQLRDSGCLYLGFTGGEPFMRRDILDILHYAKKCGFEVIVYTNGSLINEKIARELGGMRLNKIDITIPAMSKKAFESISKMSGSHSRVFRAIKFLRGAGVPLGFKTCLLKENQSEIRDIERFSASLRALHRLDTTLNRRLDGSEEPFKYRGRLEGISSADGNHRFSPIKSTKPYFSETGATASALKSTELFPCGAGLSQAAITPQGKLKMCLMIDHPKLDLVRVPFKKSWSQLKKLTSSIKPGKDYQCHLCHLKTYCKWCPAKSWLKKKSFTACDGEFRSRALANQRSNLNALLCP